MKVISLPSWFAGPDKKHGDPENICSWNNTALYFVHPHTITLFFDNSLSFKFIYSPSIFLNFKFIYQAQYLYNSVMNCSSIKLKTGQNLSPLAHNLVTFIPPQAEVFNAAST